MIQFKQYFVPVQIQETTFCREGTRTMDARRAQDILRHIINDEDYGAAMLDKISVTESIEVLIVWKRHRMITISMMRDFSAR